MQEPIAGSPGAASQAARGTAGRADPLILDHAFNARRIVVAGASANRAKWANMLFRRLVEGPFAGDVVAVNPGRERMEDRPCYPSVLDVPGDIDYVKVLVPREQAVQVLRDCVVRGVPVAHVLSAGFGEVGGAGPRLQQELLAALAGSATVMIGPNSLGLYSARAGIDFSRGCDFQPGPVTFISQSGGLCTDILALAQARGLKLGKVLSVGNCADLDWPDYARYCRHDTETGIAVFYIESVSDGRALYEELRALAGVKPVFVLKGGRTARGGRSVVSHTGRLAGDYEVWRAMMRQAGVVELDGIEDLLVTVEACGHARARPRAAAGGGIMVIGSGGGVSVLATDAAEASGLALAELAPETLARLGDTIPDAEALGGVGNPVEIPVDRMFGDLDRLTRLITVAAGDPGVGALLVHVNLIALSNNYDDGGEAEWRAVCEKLFEVSGQIAQPLVLVLRNGECGPLTETLYRAGMQRLRRQLGMPVFADMEGALRYIGREQRFGARDR